MFGVMLIMLCGILVGYLLRDRKAIPAIVSKASLYIIFLLLFIMGVSIGSNPQVIHKFLHDRIPHTFPPCCLLYKYFTI